MDKLRLPMHIEVRSHIKIQYKDNNLILEIHKHLSSIMLELRYHINTKVHLPIKLLTHIKESYLDMQKLKVYSLMTMEL